MFRSTVAGTTYYPHEVSRPWKRFIKQILRQWRAFWHHKTAESEAREVHLHWIEWARRLPQSAFLLWLAGHVADELLIHKGRGVTVPQLINAVDETSSGAIQQEAEHFIENYYFGYLSFDPHLSRVIRIFRRIIKRKLRTHLIPFQKTD